MSRTLSPLQEAIILRVSHLERLQESRLRDYLGTYFRGLEESDDVWGQDKEDPRKGRILSLALTAVTPSVTDKAFIEAATSRWPAVSVATMAVLTAGCTLLPSSQPTAKAVAPLPVYSDGTGFPSRIEQFFNGRNMVYRPARMTNARCLPRRWHLRLNASTLHTKNRRPTVAMR